MQDIYEYFKYEMPQEYKDKLTLEFIEQFQYELHMIYGLSLDQFVSDSPLLNCQGTQGWDVAFRLACEKTNNQELYDYYASLSWDKADHFDEKIINMFLKTAIMLPYNMNMFNLIVEKTRYNKDDIGYCEVCGRIYPKKFLETKIEESDMWRGEVVICKHCICQRDSQNKNANNYYLDAVNRWKNKRK